MQHEPSQIATKNCILHSPHSSLPKADPATRLTAPYWRSMQRTDILAPRVGPLSQNHDLSKLGPSTVFKDAQGAREVIQCRSVATRAVRVVVGAATTACAWRQETGSTTQGRVSLRTSYALPLPSTSSESSRPPSARVHWATRDKNWEKKKLSSHPLFPPRRVEIMRSGVAASSSTCIVCRGRGGGGSWAIPRVSGFDQHPSSMNRA